MSDKKRVLVVDDEPDIMKTTLFRLKKAGYETVSAVDGQEGLDKARSEKPDLILLDWRLPIMDGAQVYLKLKADDELKDIPVIFFTASRESEELREKMQEIGAEHVLIKPFEPEELLAKIAQLIR